MKVLMAFAQAVLLSFACASATAEEQGVVTISGDAAFENDLVVAEGHSLVISPGSALKFSEGAGIVSRGRIEAKGTKEKPISFAPRDPALGWKNVCLIGPGKEGSVFEHCLFSGGRGRTARFTQPRLEFEKFPGPADGEGADVNCGGALFVYGPGKTAIRACRFENNSAHWGGAVNCWGRACPEIACCVFKGNKGGEDAGAVHCVALSSPVISRNFFSGNEAMYGGAIHCLAQSSPVINGNYMSGNKATRNSSAISCFNRACPEITGNFIAGNEADRENGMAIETVVHSKPAIRGNYIGENRSKSGTGKGLRANEEFNGAKDESTCEEQDPRTAEEILQALRKAGVPELPPEKEKDKEEGKQ